MTIAITAMNSIKVNSSSSRQGGEPELLTGGRCVEEIEWRSRQQA
jgi:hypothetical protein